MKQTVKVSPDQVVVSIEWYELALKALSGSEGCPFCGSKREPIVSPEEETFHSRRGCLDCGEWWDPVRLKE